MTLFSSAWLDGDLMNLQCSCSFSRLYDVILSDAHLVVSPQDPLAHLYEQQENLDTGALAGFGQQVVFSQPFSRLCKH